MTITEEKYEFELSEEVRDKIRNAQNPHVLISKSDVENLTYVKTPGKTYRFVKRFGDIILSFLGLVVMLIPMGIVALAIYIDDPGKVLFRQYRVGRNGKRFRFYKFRTMREDTPKYLSTMEIEDPEQYITRLGKFLRKSSLDELPQLFNVLKGDMSLVGPRPLISDEYEIHQMRMRFGVYNVRPGVTGLAQINGRDKVGPVEKVHWDVKYVEKFGLLTDVKILLSTVPKVFGCSGVVEGNSPEQYKSEQIEE